MDISNGLAALGLVGFLLWLFLGAASLVLTVLWIATPFSVFAIRRKVDEQQETLLRIEAHLARMAEHDIPKETPRPPASE